MCNLMQPVVRPISWAPFLIALVSGCGGAGRSPRAPEHPTVPVPVLGPAEVAARIPERVSDRRAWGDAIANALGANGLTADRDSVCTVIAILGQESGFEADPVVPGLAEIVATRIRQYASRLGPFGEPLIARLLSGRAPDDARTFEQRLRGVRSERDVDVLFRDILAYHEANHPVVVTAAGWAGKLFDVRTLSELNPITTAGSMQVSVRFAEEWARAHKGKTVTTNDVREALYTRQGGVYFGTARLLAYPTHYATSIFRFADYNAGLYASRNAAVQVQLSRLTGMKLAPDGDLLAYGRDGTPRDAPSDSLRVLEEFARRFAPKLSSEGIRRDLLAEKQLAFEDTETYRAIRGAALERLGATIAYAVLPQVSISSPKLSTTRSTAWFARSVERRYRACVGDDAQKDRGVVRIDGNVTGVGGMSLERFVRQRARVPAVESSSSAALPQAVVRSSAIRRVHS